MTRESSPNLRWLIGSSTSTGTLRHEEHEIDHSVPEKAVHHVAHPVGGVLQDDFSQILPVHVPDEALRHEHRWNPHHEDSDMQNREEW